MFDQLVEDCNKLTAALKISQPRKPKAKNIEEIMARAKAMGVYTEKHGKEIYFTPPNNGKSLEYICTNQKYAWQVLDEIAADILASANLSRSSRASSVDVPPSSRK